MRDAASFTRRSSTLVTGFAHAFRFLNYREQRTSDLNDFQSAHPRTSEGWHGLEGQSPVKDTPERRNVKSDLRANARDMIPQSALFRGS